MMKNWERPPVPLEDEQWVSQFEAAKILGISVVRVGWRVACGHLQPADNERGGAGVSLASVHAEKEWRATARKRSKAARMLKDFLRGF
ncbi:DNA-binding protein [Streptomyces sp. NPDC048111]|uniref:DNA-binding protein n=1 Tax=Streptomyces sp. NPDC048111 TaxID=3365500 RepID=UPI00371AED02